MDKKKLKIIFVGIPDMALVCLSNLLIKKFDIAGVVPPRKTHDAYYYFKNFLLNKGLNIIDFKDSANDSDSIEQIEKLKADIGVVCSYNDKFSKEFLSTTKMGYINSHPSLLPQYRGGMPYFHIINNGEKESGITLHFMDESFDTGDIIYQEKFELLPYETMGTLFNKTTYMISDALIKVLDDIENGKELKRIPQKEVKNPKLAPKVQGYFKIDFKNTNIEQIERLIRACNPFYQAFCPFRGVNLQILKAHIEKKSHNFEIGTIAKVNENELAVAALDGLLYLDIFQLGSWGIFNTKEFYNIFSPQVGEKLF